MLACGDLNVIGRFRVTFAQLRGFAPVMRKRKILEVTENRPLLHISDGGSITENGVGMVELEMCYLTKEDL